MAVALAAGLATGALAASPTDPEMSKPLLRHIVVPREAIDLCGEWDYHHGLKTDKFSDEGLAWTKTVVPACVGLAVWNKPPKPSDAMYRRTFKLTKEQSAKHAELFFEQACYDTYVYVNGKLAYKSYDWSTPFRVDVTPFVRAGENTLEVRCFRAPDHPDGKDAPAVPGWVWGNMIGISRPVHLELSDPVHIAWVRVDPRVVGGKELAVFVAVTNATSKQVASEVKVKVEGEQWTAASPVVVGAGKEKVVELKEAWPEAHLWNPDDPFLYKLDVSLGGAEGTPRPTDAYRVRFGFREFRIEGRHVTLNGHPFINRRDTVGLGTSSAKEGVDVVDAKMREMVRLYKSRGFVGMRTGPSTLYRELEVCDEMGFLVSPLLPTGAGYSRNPPYWSAVSNMVRRAAEAYRNHPSMTYWCLFNEFGKNYGVGAWKAQYPKMVAMGEYLKAFDPTTFWTSCGDTELDPVNGNGPGPAPVRSLHYPVNTSYGGNDFPEVGWWYANGRAGWQGLGSPDKPTFISEDLYHGMNDSAPSMTRWGSDAIYEADGYVKAWRDAILMFADGHYYGGLGEWNPWFTCSGEKNNKLFEAGELMPTYLVSLRHAFPNLAAGSVFEDDLYVHNQSFTPRKLKLDLTYSWTGKTETREIELPPGGRYDGKLRFDVPAADGASPKPLEVVAKLLLGASNVFSRTFRFNAIPLAKQFPKGAVLLASGETPLKAMFAAESVVKDAAAAFAAKPSLIVIAGALEPAEGRKLDAWVQKGGKALLFACADGWSPISVRDKMTHAYAWRRNGDFLKDIPENLFSVWRPTATIGNRALSIPTDCDAQVLLDEGSLSGISAADVIRLRQGEGVWLVTSLPVEASFTEEPAARYLAVRLAVDQLNWQAQPDGGFAFLTKNHPLAEFFKANLFLPETKVGKAGVVIADVADAARGASGAPAKNGASGGGRLAPRAVDAGEIIALARSGKTVFVTGVSSNSVPRALLGKLGLGYEPVKPWVHPPKEPKVWKAPVTDERRDWFTHLSNDGLLAGISNTDLFFSKIDLGSYYRGVLTGINRLRGDTLPAVTGHFDGYGLVFPNAMAEVPVGKGRVVVTSFDWETLAVAYPSKTLKIWRNLLMNCGVRTAPTVERHTLIPLRMNGNAHLWDDPDKPLKVPAFFGNGDDLRYFPVNLCGWSIEADNKCPVQEFPTDTLYFGGIPFRLTAPNNKNGGTVRINSCTLGAPDKGGKRLDRIWVLAALEDDEGLKPGDTVVDMLIQNGKDKWHTSPALGAVAKYGEDLGAYRNPINPTRGKVGWMGHSQGTLNAALYVFSIENVFDKSIPVQSVVLRAMGGKGKPTKRVAFIGATWQVD